MFFNVVLVFLTLITRFWGLWWGNGFFFHPDENNMAMSLSQLTTDNFNPHFFAYGQFPLYLGYFSLKLLALTNTFTNSVYILRFWSALFSCLSVFFFYQLFRSRKFVFFLIFTPGLIQIAHFGTTESLLCLVFSINLYLSLQILRHPKFLYFFLISLSTGIGLATKISSLIFLAPLFLAVILTKYRNKLHLLLFTVYCLLFTLLFFLIFSPYNLIARSDFLSTINYETQVATGAIKVFYTTQFINTLPYLFQLIHIFPYALGLPILLFGLIGVLRVPRNGQNLIIILSALAYFLYFGQIYTKWTRFMSPIFFVFPLTATYFVSNIKKSFIVYLISFIIILPGVLFMKLYFSPDVRLVASTWITDHLPSGSTILSEAGNVVNLPIANSDLSVTNYDFYDSYNPVILASTLINSDYILLPSRRVFANYHYPYYQHLFDGSLGFTKIKEFAVFNDEKAEETWSVFDHPRIRLYQKTRPLNLVQYETLLKS